MSSEVGEVQLLEFFVPQMTEHFVIRAFCTSDAKLLHALETDPGVKTHLDKPPQHSVDYYKISIANNRFSAFAIASKHNDELAGRCSLQQTDALWLTSQSREDTPEFSVEVTCVLSKPYQGRGFGEEIISRLIDIAFNEIGASAVYAETSNPKAKHINEKLGFKEIGKDGIKSKYVRYRPQPD